MTPDLIRSTRVHVFEDEERLVAVAQVDVHDDRVSLDKLYVDPSSLGAGLGRKLFDWAVTVARESGARAISIDADPHAAEFYRRMGAIDDGLVASGSIPGRFLPRLTFHLRAGS